MGISYKRFLGWAPTPDDPVEWDATEREWMLALQSYEASRKCPICGMDIEFCHNEQKVHEMFAGGQVETCHVSEMRERAMSAYAETGDVKAPNSQTTNLIPRGE